MKKLAHYAQHLLKEILHNNESSEQNTVNIIIDTILFVKTQWYRILACSFEKSIAKEVFQNTEVDDVKHEILFIKVKTTQTRFILDIHQHNILNTVLSIQAETKKSYVHIKKIMFISY